MKVSRVNEMRDLDAEAVKKLGIREELLMENAGLASCQLIDKEYGAAGKRFLIFCGGGNNGGDGFVVARKIHSNGGIVNAVLLGEPEKYTGAAGSNLAIIKTLSLSISEIKTVKEIPEFIENSDVLIDAIFGTGLDRPVEGKYEEIIDLINASGKPVVSLDIPSGINGNTGEIMGTAIRANHTISFGLPKIGNLLYPGFEYGGSLSVTHISFPPEHYDNAKLKISVNNPLPLPERPVDAHKGICGKVLFVAGSSLYFGAPYFAAESFLKAGGGLSFLATPETVSPFVAGKGSEIVFLPLTVHKSGSITMKNLDTILEFSDKVDMVVVGPGLSLNRGTQNLVRNLSTEITKPLLIDGDGLTAISDDKDCITDRSYPTILTPHLGEMSRLVGKTIGEIQKRKIDVVQATAKILNAIIVLKGAHTIIGTGKGEVFINLSGNPGMATAGSGDVLTGTISAMFGLGLPIDAAVRNGVFIHGYAGDLAAEELGQDGMVASDIMSYLPKAMRLMRKDQEEIARTNYNKIQLI
jgi:hydroxyethylthiazole kinase-like uncharacterized protein yjeF